MKHKTKWYKLDTSATIYPALESVTDPHLFRVSMTLKEEIDPKILLEALESTRNRFPYYNVSLKQGFFWSYLEENDNKFKIWQDHPIPCEKIYPVFNNGYLYKIKYFKNKISLDIFHVLTDGTGAMEFLKTIVHQYLYLKGEIAEDQAGIMSVNDKPQKEEEEDAFLTVLEKEKNKIKKDNNRALFNNSKNYKIKEKHLSSHKFKVITGVLSIDEVKKITKKYDATVTQLLAALYIEAGIRHQALKIKDKNKHKHIAVQIPFNMRKFYKYNCMRNFTLFITPTIDPRKVNSLEDIITEVKKQMKESLTYDYIIKMVNDNCELAKNPFIKHVPVGIKNLVIRFINNTKGTSRFIGIISNLGLICLPEKSSEKIEEVSFLIGPTHTTNGSCGVTGYNNKIYMTFGRSTNNTYIERHIITSLVKMGVNVKIKSNY